MKYRRYMMEIGSEFYLGSSSAGYNAFYDLCDYPKRFVLSGRTGLYLIAEEIKPNVNKIILPSYCCGSMIAPFVSNGITVSFYDAFDTESIAFNETTQAVLIMDYFGFVSDKTYDLAKRCKQAGKIIIVDATQTAFSRIRTYDLADYVVVSYRKWFDCLCAVVYSKNGFITRSFRDENRLYSEIWRKAARNKEKYIRTTLGEKSDFLDQYAEANHLLEDNYAGYIANEVEIERMRNVDSIVLREKRRSNAYYLIGEIKKFPTSFDVKLLFDNVDEDDCPLFVPILLNEKKRGYIRNELIGKDIYCPIHWPIDMRYPYQKTLYHETELSLVCDQRYGLEEMKKQIEVLSHAIVSIA